MFYELLAVIFVLGTVVVVSTAILRGGTQHALPPSATAAIESGDRWHAHATRMARGLERLLDDPLVACTIPEDQREALRAQVGRFWADVEGDAAPSQ